MARNKALRLATFNANSIRSRLPIVLDWLAARRPDVLCLQETKVSDEQFPHEPFEAAGYRIVFRGAKGRSGVAIATLGEPAEVSFGFDRGRQRDEDRIARIRYQGIAIVNTYVPQGQQLDSPMFRYKLKWFARLLDLFKRNYSPDEPLVWLGDLNVAPEEIDLHDPKGNKNHVCFHQSVRAAFRKVVAWGFADLFRRHHADPGCYTFWDYRLPTSVVKNIGWRVDLILATRPAAERSLDCLIDKEPRLKDKPSDHTFVLAELAPESRP